MVQIFMEAKMKLALSVVAVSTISLHTAGQVSKNSDTIAIKEVVISSMKMRSELTGFMETEIDSLVQKQYNLLSLEDLLSMNSFIYIKSYGPGGSATPSFRGTGASHTQINWNGLNINNPMLGQSDFSIVPAGMADLISIAYGGASMNIGSGGIGGSVNIENKPGWTDNSTIDINTGLGSFKSYSGFSRIKAGNQHFQTVTKAYFQSSQNHFRYRNVSEGIGSEWVRRENSEMLQKGFMEELYFKINNDVLSSRFWYHSASRNLPGSLLYDIPDSGEKQIDESFRSMLNYDHSGSVTDFFITAAHMTTRLNYSFPLYLINSLNQTESFVFKGGITRHVGKLTDIRLVVNDEYTGVESNNYKKDIYRNVASVIVSAEKKMGQRMGATILFSETLNGNKLLFPDFTGGLEFRPVKEKNHFLRMSFARNSKIPSLNDCYWSPGGNPDLRNEYAYTFEAGYRMVQFLFSHIELSADINYFYSHLRDMIQWHQGEGFYWIADNISSVNNSGLESLVSLKYASGDFSMNLNGGYSFTKTISRDSLTRGKQLVYVPEHQANASLQASYKPLYLIWMTGFTGRRFTVSDNSGYLPAYSISNIISGIKINLKESSVDFNIRIENIFNVSYQAVEYYPQPGRSYYLTLRFQFHI